MPERSNDDKSDKKLDPKVQSRRIWRRENRAPDRQTGDKRRLLLEAGADISLSREQPVFTVGHVLCLSLCVYVCSRIWPHLWPVTALLLGCCGISRCCIVMMPVSLRDEDEKSAQRVHCVRELYSAGGDLRERTMAPPSTASRQPTNQPTPMMCRYFVEREKRQPPLSAPSVCGPRRRGPHGYVCVCVPSGHQTCVCVCVASDASHPPPLSLSASFEERLREREKGPQLMGCKMFSLRRTHRRGKGAVNASFRASCGRRLCRHFPISSLRFSPTSIPASPTQQLIFRLPLLSETRSRCKRERRLKTRDIPGVAGIFCGWLHHGIVVGG